MVVTAAGGCRVPASIQPDTGEGDEHIVAEINITPLTDVFLVLLIIFMVTSSAITNTGKNVDLPEAALAFSLLLFARQLLLGIAGGISEAVRTIRVQRSQ